ncbi:MAG: hypothetical protein J6W09_06700 [Bacteroidales bacterium]|nr:hypothetical protein [Bacteroidales bacterium]
MKKNLFIVALCIAAMAAYSCQKEQGEPTSVAPSTEAESQKPVLDYGQVYCITPKSVDESEPAAAPADTKTAWGEIYDGNKLDVLWLDGDAVKLYSASVTDGAVYAAAMNESADEATFVAQSTVVEDATRYAVYPASMAGAMQDGKIPVDLSVFASQMYHSTLAYYGQKKYYEANQDYLEATIVPHLPLFASSDSEEFQFQNLCGAVNLRLNDYQGHGIRIASVKITTDKYISGTMLVNPADGTVTLIGTSDAQKSFTVNSSVEGTPISGNAPGFGASYNWFFFLPVGTYNGMTFTITDTEGNVYTKSTANTITVNPGKVGRFPVAQLTVYYGSANCILAPKDGVTTVDITPRYTFDEGFSYSSGAATGKSAEELGLTAELVWEVNRRVGATGNSITTSSKNFVVSDVSISGNTLSITPASKAIGGNALVAIKKGDNTVWSFHIWFRNEGGAANNRPINDLTFSIGGQTFQMMDRNLGAPFALPVDDNGSQSANLAYMTYGLLYQWGRKEPLPLLDNTTTYGDGATALFHSSDAKNASVQYLLNNPLERVQETGSNKSTLPQNGKNVRLWGAPSGYAISSSENILSYAAGFQKSVYDPCPEGYMVPQAYYFSGLTVNTSSRQGYCAKLNYNGTNWTYFSLPGFVASSESEIVAGTTKTTTAGTYGWLWCSNPYGTGGWAGCRFEVSYTSSKVSLGKGYGASSACLPVRCMRIPE